MRAALLITKWCLSGVWKGLLLLLFLTLTGIMPKAKTWSLRKHDHKSRPPARCNIERRASYIEPPSDPLG